MLAKVAKKWRRMDNYRILNSANMSLILVFTLGKKLVADSLKQEIKKVYWANVEDMRLVDLQHDHFNLWFTFFKNSVVHFT
jgi:hypothetical protein